MLKRLLRKKRSPGLPQEALVGALLRRADGARDLKRFRDAAALYGEAISLGAAGGPVRVQAGHMFKEAGDFDLAERFYLEAVELLPKDADLALQLGHFYKTAGRLRDAQSFYHKALKLSPDWELPQTELRFLRDGGWAPSSAAGSGPADNASPVTVRREKETVLRNTLYETLVPELMPRAPEEIFLRHAESIQLRRLGRVERTYWGDHLTLRGVEAIRGFCISEAPIFELQILLNGVTIHRGPTRAYKIRNELENHKLRKHVFNAWVDLQDHLPGKYLLEIRFRDAQGARDDSPARLHRQDIVIAEPLPEPLFEGGDAWTPPTDPSDPRTVEEQVDARASIVSEARRSIFKQPPRNVLVLRTDQLGDVVASVPAMRRLREIFKDANIVGLFTSANADLARTLGVFDEIIVINFPDEKEIQRRRVMSAEDQTALRERLAPYAFDLALDLAPARESRPLLLLSGAPFLAGMRDKEWPYINAGFDLNTYDPVGRSDIMPASSKTLAFVESLGIMMASNAEVIRRPEITRNLLTPFDLGPDDSYVTVHTGARVVFSRWAYYMELCERILARTPHKIVMLSDDPLTRDQLPPALAANERFQLLDRRLDFDQFDALLSFCTCFVGNDSGPKHLASLRGSNVVSLHTARINWGEWGQEQTGKVIHRQVPCAGCHVYHDPEECGKDYACVSLISLDEVWGAMEPYL